MVRRTFADRISDLDQPDMRTDEEEIWGVVRAILTLTRIAVLLSIIIIAEMLEEYFFNGLSVAIWSLIIGIPLFFALSISIILGDRFLGKDKENESTVIRPIRQRS